jgi:hypothetical protein
MVKSKLTKAEKQRDLSMVADLQYYVLPEPEEKLKSLESDQEKASAALYDQILDEDSKVFTHTIGSAQIRKMVDKLTSEGRILPNSDSAFKAAMLVEGSESLAAPDLKNELPCSGRSLESSELPTHGKLPELSDTSRTELEGGTTRGPQELNDTSKAELEASTPGPRCEFAATPIRGKIELESLNGTRFLRLMFNEDQSWKVRGSLIYRSLEMGIRKEMGMGRQRRRKRRGGGRASSKG